MEVGAFGRSELIVDPRARARAGLTGDEYWFAMQVHEPVDLKLELVDAVIIDGFGGQAVASLSHRM